MNKTDKFLRTLKTPAKIQDFLDTLPFNFEKKGETYRSVRRTLEAKTAHCFEGALVAAAALRLQGQRPLILDLRSSEKDDDHVIALFRKGKYWGAISKTNHAALRYREPVYASVRELVMSYFHEYIQHDGRKTLYDYSKPFDLSKIKIDWGNGEAELFELIEKLDKSSHVQIVPKGHKLRPADKIERKAAEIVEYKTN